MALTDPISDMLTVIRNATRAGHDKADVKRSKFTMHILEVLKRERFIYDFKIIEDNIQASLRAELFGKTGKEVAEGGYRHETLRFGFGAPVYTATINFDRVALYGNHNQEKMVEVQQSYGSKVRVQFDQQNGLFFLESRSSDLTVKDVMRKFDLISARDYFAQFEREYREAPRSA